jgi:hypothetical protein
LDSGSRGFGIAIRVSLTENPFANFRLFGFPDENHFARFLSSPTAYESIHGFGISISFN